jgi:hypothetical protein
MPFGRDPLKKAGRAIRYRFFITRQKKPVIKRASLLSLTQGSVRAISDLKTISKTNENL